MNKGFTPLENGHKKNSPVSLNGMNKPNKSLQPLEKAAGNNPGADNVLTGFTPLHPKDSFFGRNKKSMFKVLPQRIDFIPDGLTDVTGFTLIELMVVIVLIGILGIIAVPNMRSWYTGFQARGACDNITNTLVTARMLAVKNGNDVVVVFYTGNNCPSSVAGINTNEAGTNCYFTINDINNACQSLADVAGGSCITTGTFNGVVNALPSSIVFPATMVPNSASGFTVTTDYCVVTGLNSQPCAIPNSCTFCTGNVGAIAFQPTLQPNGFALLLSAINGNGNAVANLPGGSVTIIPSVDLTNNNDSNECAVGVIGLTGDVKEFY